MNAADLIGRLKRMEPELRSAGVDALYLFGSHARGDHGPDSDIDLAFDLDSATKLRFSLLDRAKLMVRLSDELKNEVDFVERNNLRPRIRERFDTDAVKIFG